MAHFIREGFEKTSIESITRAAGVAKGTFYSFFEKKEDVLLYYLDRELVKSRHEIQRRIDALPTIIDKLELLILTYLKYIFRSKDFSRVLVKERIAKIGTGKNWNELILFQTIRQLLEDAQARGEIRKDVELANMSEVIFAIFTMYTIYWLNGLITTKKQCLRRIKEVLRMFFDGVGP